MRSKWCQQTLAWCRWRGHTGGAESLCQQEAWIQLQPWLFFSLQHLAAGFLKHALDVFSRRFTNVFRAIQSGWFWSCLPKRSLAHWPCIMGFHWGRVTRTSAFLPLWWRMRCWQEETLFSVGTLMLTQSPLPACLSHTYTHRGTHNANEQPPSFPVCACMGELHVWPAVNKVPLSRPNVFSVIRMTHSQMNLKLSISLLSLTAQHRGHIFISTLLLCSSAAVYTDEKRQHFLNNERFDLGGIISIWPC